MVDNKFHITYEEFVGDSYEELEAKAREQRKKGSNKSKALEEQETRK